ncbi:hypothetical protein C6P97_09740 [Burkholderia multivorans]|uniref:Uncharacterized protein n=1 Tax=Burkholderia multivorans TaxID=87883 RepID=A0AB37ALM8_9BURK|nr:hypothetical protein C6P99_27390 [Burkholderia multivorans]PRE51130.1 hypothetical protein C6P97_09740 [Burkholderia multivorans]
MTFFRGSHNGWLCIGRARRFAPRRMPAGVGRAVRRVFGELFPPRGRSRTSGRFGFAEKLCKMALYRPSHNDLL